MTEEIKKPEEPQPTSLQPSARATYLDAVEADSALEPTTLGGLMRLAEVISKAGLCPKHLKNDAGSVLLVMAASRQIGIPWFAGLQKAYVIDGKVAWEAVVLGAVAKRSSRCKLFYLEVSDAEKATVVVQTASMPEPKRVTYTYEQAKSAGLAGKGPWNAWRQNMLVARATTNAARWYFGEETLGLETIEELREVAALEPAPAEPKNVTPAPGEGVVELLDRVAAATETVPQEILKGTAKAAVEPEPERMREPGEEDEEPQPGATLFS